MEKLSLREIAAQLGCPQPPEGEITRVITDSREAGPGTLFVALPGERVDGHDYINRALAAGAEAAVAEHDGDYTPAEKVLRVKSSLRALLEISALYRANAGPGDRHHRQRGQNHHQGNGSGSDGLLLPHYQNRGQPK